MMLIRLFVHSEQEGEVDWEGSLDMDDNRDINKYRRSLKSKVLGKC